MSFDVGLESPTSIRSGRAARPDPAEDAASYTEIRRQAPWAARPPDVSLSEGDFVYDPNSRLQRVR